MNRPVPELYPGDPCWTCAHEFHACECCGETSYKHITWKVEPSTIIEVKIEQDCEWGADGVLEYHNHCTMSYMAANGAFGNTCMVTEAEAEARCAELNKEDGHGKPS